MLEYFPEMLPLQIIMLRVCARMCAHCWLQCDLLAIVVFEILHEVVTVWKHGQR